MLISPEYVSMNAQLHTSDGYGVRCLVFADEVKRLAAKLGTHELLDYGCGKERLKEALGPDYTVHGYDPAIEGLHHTPSPCGFVVCFDVLEHVEPEFLNNVLDDLRRVTTRELFLSVATCKSSRLLSDGRNAHLIIEQIDWWLPKLRQRFKIKAGQFSPLEFVVRLT